jgi:hypothetical protein
MKTLGAILRELLGLFVEDGALALQIMAVVLLATLSATFLPDVPLAAGAILLFGSLGTLAANVGSAFVGIKPKIEEGGQ